MSELATAPQVTKHRGRWKWFLGLGGVLVLLGITGISLATLLQVTSLLLFGPLLWVSSIIQLVTAFLAEKRKEALLHFAAAGLEAVLGFIVLAHPLDRPGSLIALVAVFLMVGGLVRLVRPLFAESRGRGWTVMTGVVALLLGISVWIGWPVAKLWVVGLCIAVDFICHGVSWSALALADREPGQAPAS